MRKEVIISDLAAAVREKERLAGFCTSDRWEVVSYETAAGFSGNLLLAMEESYPQPVTVAPELEGWYRIYVCMVDTGGSYSGKNIHLKLSGDRFSRCMCARNVKEYCTWNSTEAVEEIFWKCADMTGQTITIEKIDDAIKHVSNLVWLRFEPISKEEAQSKVSTRTMLAHMDPDFSMCDNARTPEDFCKAIDTMKDSDIGIVCQEIFDDDIVFDLDDPEKEYWRAWERHRLAYSRRLVQNKAEIYAGEIAYAHEQGMKLFAAHRMQMSNFGFPYHSPHKYVPFIDEHPEFRCKARTGSPVEFLSYGYKEVQDVTIATMLRLAKAGFDGVEHLWIRGQHLMFEEPVIERFREKFGDGVDVCRLPANDPRLTEVRSDILTEFYRRLRKALNDYAEEQGVTPLKIYVAVYFDKDSAKADALDVERWAAEGLIDGIVQSKMTVWEETDDVLAEDGLVDLAKYEKKSREGFVYRRMHGNQMEKIYAAIPAYREISDRYGVELYSEVQWENTVLSGEYVEAARQIYQAGGKNIVLWDCYPGRTAPLADWNAQAWLGTAERAAEASVSSDAYHRVYKVLSYGGKNFQYNNPSWRG